MFVHRLARYPPAFLARHPIHAARNSIGNHPSPLANRYLRGLSGIEIGGAAYNDFFLDTINVDHSPTPTSVPMQLKHAGRKVPVDVVARAETLPFPDRAYDFLLASHVLEHMPDPIRALGEWLRVSRRYVYLILPQPDIELKAGRPLTTLQELIDRNRAGFTSADELHWSIWSSETFAELCRHMELEILEIQDPDDKRGNGFAVVLDAHRSSSAAAVSGGDGRGHARSRAAPRQREP